MACTNATKISWITGTIVNINAMIGAGIFALPLVLIKAGPSSLIVFLGVLAAVVCLALSLATVAGRLPAGSLYEYAASWGGRRVGVAALFCYLSGLVVAMGLLTQVVGAYIAEFVQLCIPSVVCSPLLCSFIALTLLVVVIMRGHAMPTWAQRLLIFATLTPIVVVTILGLRHAQWSNLLPFAPRSLETLFSAVKAAAFGFFGFECATSLAAQFQNPREDVPRAVVWSIFAVGFIYLMFIAAIMLAIPAASISAETETLTQVLLLQFPRHPWLIHVIGAAIISAVLGTLHSMIWSSAALLVTTVKTQAPAIRMTQSLSAVIIGVAIAIICSVVHNLDLFFSLTSLGIVSSYVLAIGNVLWAAPAASARERYIAYGGLFAAFIMILCALHGVMMAV